MILHSAQKIIAKSKKRFRVCCCGRRFGKTTLAVLEMVGKGIAKDNQRIAYIAPTYQQARDIAWQELKNITRPIQVNVNESRLEVEIQTQHGGTSHIWLRGWENIETLRGQKFDFIVIDEIASMRNYWLNWQEVIRPTLTDTRGDAMFISTPKGFNHFYDLFNTKEDNFESFHFSSYDNPFLPVEELDEAKGQMTRDRFDQEYMAEFRKMEGLVYKEFKREKHLYKDKEPENFVETICGVDFGYTNPASVLPIRIDKDDHYWIGSEWYKRKQTNAQIIEVVKGLSPNIVYPDPAEPDRIAEMVEEGINTRDVSKDIVAGVDRVRELFKQGRIHIHESCKNLIWELETYHYPENRNPEGKNDEEKPEKKDDHLMDALRYALYTHNPKESRIKHIPQPPTPSGEYDGKIGGDEVNEEVEKMNDKLYEINDL